MLTNRMLQVLDDAKIGLDVDTASFGDVVDAIRNTIPDDNDIAHELLDALKTNHLTVAGHTDLLLRKMEEYLTVASNSIGTVIQSRDAAAKYAHDMNVMFYTLVMADPEILVYLKQQHPEYADLLATFEDQEDYNG